MKKADAGPKNHIDMQSESHPRAKYKADLHLGAKKAELYSGPENEVMELAKKATVKNELEADLHTCAEDKMTELHLGAKTQADTDAEF